MNPNPTITRFQALALAAVIFFALTLMLPMTSTARSSGKSTVCLANLHILGRAWLAYAKDNDGRIVGGSTGSTDAPYYSWVQWPDNSAAPELQEKMQSMNC